MHSDRGSSTYRVGHQPTAARCEQTAIAGWSGLPAFAQNLSLDHRGMSENLSSKRLLSEWNNCLFWPIFTYGALRGIGKDRSPGTGFFLGGKWARLERGGCNCMGRCFQPVRGFGSRFGSQFRIILCRKHSDNANRKHKPPASSILFLV